MKIRILQWSITLAATFVSAWSVASSSLELTPNRNLSLEQVAQVARQHTAVKLSEQSWHNIEQGHQVIMQAAVNNVPVYGLTVGVGWNKDKPVFKEENGQKIVSDELIQLSQKFNRDSLKAHAAGLGNPLPEEIVRASMLIRLNTLQNGETGVQKAVAQQYVTFLNEGITPVVPSKGTVGEADITLAAHIGLAMMGEWDVFYQGKRQPAKQVLEKLNITPLQPVGKDFLSILSNNSLMAAEAVFIALDSEQFLQKQIALFGLMLESYNGNVAPFSEASIKARPFKSLVRIATQLRETLQGSDLWQTSDKRALQDPLSFRSMAYSLANVEDNISSLKEALSVQINHSDDNPLVLIESPDNHDSTQLKKYEIDGSKSGAIYPTANFNFLPVVAKIEYLNQSFAKLAEVMSQQLIRLENPEFTQLSRFLAAPKNEGHAFGAIQKPFLETNVQIKQWALPVSYQSATLAGNIEDTATFSGIALANSRAILNGLYEIASFQLLHGTQALDLRQHKISASTQKIWQQYRQHVPFIEQDTIYTPLIAKGIEFWKGYSIK